MVIFHQVAWRSHGGDHTEIGEDRTPLDISGHVKTGTIVVDSALYKMSFDYEVSFTTHCHKANKCRLNFRVTCLRIEFFLNINYVIHLGGRVCVHDICFAHSRSEWEAALFAGRYHGKKREIDNKFKNFFVILTMSFFYFFANCENNFSFSMKRDLDTFLFTCFFQLSHTNHSLPETFVIDDTFFHFSS